MDRIDAIKRISIEYVRKRKLAEHHYRQYLDAKDRGLMRKYYDVYWEEFEKHDDDCFNLDISLGYLVEEGDYETIAEYREALQIHLKLEKTRRKFIAFPPSD